MTTVSGDYMATLEEAEADIIALVNDKQEVTFSEINGYANSNGIEPEVLKRSLSELEKANAIAARSTGGILTYYMLQEGQPIKRVFIVEDDKNINKLMALSIGKSFDILQIYDGSEALERIKYEKPDLVILDLMLPGVDGLTICQEIKTNANLKDTIVIIVSALDATSNRFKGIKYGADYYIKKPFDPEELRGLVTIFLKKKGKKFDPLIDLPNAERISEELESAIKAPSEDYEIGKLKLEGLADFASRFGNEAGMTILRLVSQLLQDKIKETGDSTFVGFLDGDDFMVAGTRTNVEKVVDGIRSEFSAVEQFVYQSEGYKPIEQGIENFGFASQLSLLFNEIRKDQLIERRAEVLKNKPAGRDIGSYTYEELRHMLGSDNLDISIKRDTNGVRLSVGKSVEKKEK